MKNYTFYLKHLRCFLLGTGFLLFTSQAKAQAPDNIKGYSITVSVTDGVDPLAETGKWIGLPSATSDEFVLAPITSNVSPTLGTYKYSKTSANTGELSVHNAIENYNATIKAIFSSKNSGSVRIEIDENPQIFQEGTFTIKKGNVPESMVGRKAVCTVTYGTGIHGEYGVWEWIPSSDGTYVVNALSGDLVDSKGTYRIVRESDATAQVIYNDSEVGIGGTLQLTFDTDNTGALFLVSQNGVGAGFQTGIFKIESTGDVGNQGLVITKQPIPVTVAEGQPVQFKVEADATGQLNYQWTKGGAVIPQANAAVYTITSAKKSDEGTYQAILTSGNKTYESDAVKLTVLKADDENKEPSSKKWEFETGGPVGSSPAIGSDGTIYIGSEDYNLYAINPDGSKKWALKTGAEVTSSPAIGSDSTIYVGSYDYNLYAINPDGSKKWAFKTGAEVTSSPAIGSDGTIYVGSYDYNLYAINPDGSKKWAFKTGAEVTSSPAIGSDGTIYVGSDYNRTADASLLAISPDGTKKWAFKTGHGDVGSSPAIGSDGTIYVGSNDRNLYAINPDGSKKWALKTGNAVWSSPAIGSDGTIYIGSNDHNLYAINPDGSKKWAFKTGAEVTSSPAIGSDGTIYVGSYDYNLYAINPDGSKKWAFKTGAEVTSSPAIGSDGTIYIGSEDYNLYAINSHSRGPANSVWPMYRGNQWRNGNRSTPPEIITHPIDQIAGTGKQVKFSVELAIGSRGLFSWYKGSSLIPGKSSNTLTIENASLKDEGEYKVKVSNPFAEVWSEPAKLEIEKVAPTILSQPESLNVESGSTVQFSITADGGLDYLWYYNGKPIEGANEPTLIIEDVHEADEGIYSVRVKNDFGKAISEIAKLEVFGFQPEIISQPEATFGYETQSVTFNVDVKGSGPFVFQWIKDGETVGTERSITLSNLTFEDAGLYSVLVSNEYGAVISDTAELKVLDPAPAITVQPKSGEVKVGDNHEFSVEIKGVRPFSFQWHRNDKAIEEAKTQRLLIESASNNDLGNYYVVVKNEFGEARSENASLGLKNTPPSIITQPSSITAKYGETLELKVGALGSLPLTYRWYKDGEIIKDQTSETVVTENLSDDSEGEYQCELSNQFGVVVSDIVTVKINRLKWAYATNGIVNSSPAIGSDGTIFVGSYDNNLYAINPDGSKKWSFNTRGWVRASPSVGSDGTIYVGSMDKYLYAINSDGSGKWSFGTGNDVFSSSAIGSDGTIFVGSQDSNLYAINPDGSKKWAFETGDSVNSSPAIGSDGTIFVGSHDSNLYAINPDGTKKWAFETGDSVNSSPAIGSDGTIYVGSWDGKLYALNPDGSKKWVFKTATP